ncbi:MAG TPA: DUF2066 domain-containing protein [Xanthomonadaceae bacterium]|nr:DUF2066 domain-containing protein [Xanthomonadaceae bacterium]
MLPRPTFSLATLVLAVLLAALAGPGAAAQGALSLYEGEARVTSQDAGERNAVLPKALAQVFVKLTGDPQAVGQPALARHLPDAQSLMRQYRYRQSLATIDGQPVVRLYVVAAFDRSRVDAILAGAGVAVWPQPRPEPLVWLAIDDGRGARLVSRAQSGAAAPLIDEALERGLVLRFPAQEDARASPDPVAAAWSGETEPLVEASRRHGASTLLVGRLQRSDGTWRSRWIVVDAGRTVSSFDAADPDPRKLMVRAGGLAVDALASHYSNPALLGTPGEYVLELSGVDSVTAYAEALGALRELAVVRELWVEAADGDRLRLRVALGTGVEGLLRLLEGSRVLSVDDRVASDPRWGPADARLVVRR